jgi:hypothetical protein
MGRAGTMYGRIGMYNRVLVRKPEGMTLQGKPRRMYDNIKIDVREME